MINLPITPSFQLEGKRALVTGAGRGIGLGVATAFARAGAHVTLCARSENEIAMAADALNVEGLSADFQAIDVTNIEAFSKFVGSQPAYDIFLNNAGTNIPKPMNEVIEKDYDIVMGLNVKAAYFALQAVSGKMIAAENGGSIINMSSQMGHVGAANRSLYCASKWALEGLSKAMAIELGGHNIRVNTICPTFIETPMTKPFFEDEEFKKSVLSKIKLGRIGQIEDIMGGAVFLASDASSLMTGSALMIDGGWTAE
ncbi:MAG: SDR family oxidoreductase [OCS116 cluster bacterium]|uniref:3-oxoacyl-ACP reductase n=1 Tax=OCS116 cluster bacterium TaxID=2030921 RepID=A0A2A4Z079_9PROT|nr:SDR family oxidoreductase [OCS116 cluster bacterium]